MTCTSRFIMAARHLADWRPL